MKKNKMMRLASCLLVLVMLSTSMISGTFAKYVTTGSAEDTARVAKFGVDIKYIDNIVRMQRITRVPKVQEYIKGVINLRGEVIPIISVRMKMDLDEDEITKKTRIIILKLDQHDSVGVLVDEVKEVVTLDEEHIEKITYDKDEKAKILFGECNRACGFTRTAL